MNEAERQASNKRVAAKLSAQLNALTPGILTGINAAAYPSQFSIPRNDPGRGRSTEWEAEDGWLVGYSTSRIIGGQYNGKFLVTAHRPYGKGSRSGRGNVERWRIAYARAFTTRKAAKARALQLYGQHSPRWSARRA